MPFFTVIIPTYNRAHMLPKAIESVLIQTFSDWELIIVDDGSTDNTRDVVSSYRDQRIRYIYQNNAERSAARNNGIKNAKGEYICFLDSDDYYCKNHLEVFHDTIQKTHAKFMYSLKVNDPTLHFPNDYELVFASVIHSQQVCVHHSLFEKELFDPSLRIGEDTELWLRLLSHTGIVCTGKQTIHVVDHEDRTVNIKNSCNFDHYLLLKKLAGKYKKNISRKLRNTVISNSLFRIANHYLYNEKYYLARKFLLKSIVRKFLHPQTKAKIHMLFFPKKHRIL